MAGEEFLVIAVLMVVGIFLTVGVYTGWAPPAVPGPADGWSAPHVPSDAPLADSGQTRFK